jgi:hypothetical protein
MSAEDTIMTIFVEKTGSIANIPDLHTFLKEGMQIIQDTVTKMGGTVQGFPPTVWIQDNAIRFDLSMAFQVAALREFFGQSPEPADRSHAK